MGAIELNGAWWRVDAAYMTDLTDMVLLTAQQHAWTLDALPEADMSAALAADGYDGRSAASQLPHLPPTPPSSLSHLLCWLLFSSPLLRHAAL